MKKKIIGVATLAMLLVTGCSQRPSDELAETMETKAPETELAKQTEETIEVSDVGIDPMEIREILQENYGEMAEVSYDKFTKTFRVDIVEPGVVAEIAQVIDSGDAYGSWEALAESVAELSRVVGQALGKGYTIEVGNPVNPERHLLSATNGYVTYNFMVD